MIPLLAEHIAIAPASEDAARAARERVDQLTKPLGSLGRLEDLAVRLCAIAGVATLTTYEQRAILVGAADHGVTEAGVSAYPREVTAQMVGGFLGGSAAICALARSARAEVWVANFGVDADFAAHPRLIDVPIGRGTRNFAAGGAMSAAEAEAALLAGANAVEVIDPERRLQLIGLGEMGIGNTTSAAAIICALTGAAAEEIVGRGTGADDGMLARKIRIVSAAAARCNPHDWCSIATEVGGFEIVGLAGAMLAAASRSIPIVLDGFIVAAAALLARAVNPLVIDYCIASHCSRERGHGIALDALGLTPLFDLHLRLGEASGAALAIPIIEAAARMYSEMKTFAEAGVATKLAE